MDTTHSEPDSTARQPRPFQFRVKDVLLATAWLAVLLAIYTQVTDGGSLLFAILWCAVPLTVAARRGLMSPGEATAVWSIICIIIASLACLLMLVATTPSPGFSRRTTCRNNMRQIGLALWEYDQKYGCLPPAYIADANGKPMHSWRVLILPFMNQQKLYDQYNFREPWDGPNNKKLHGISVQSFCCPSDSQNGSGTCNTSYVAVAGPGTAWPGTTSTSTKMVADGLSNTIFFVEVANSGIHSMEPRDLPVAAVDAGINPTRGLGISSGHPGGVNVAWMDGSCYSLDETTPPDLLHALLTIRGQEPLMMGNDGPTLAPPVKAKTSP